MNSGCFPFVSRKAQVTGFWQIQNPRLAGIIHVGWDKVAQVVGGPSDDFLSQCAAPQSLKSATVGPPFMEFARPTLPMR
jgi:hypothetical protein